MNIKRRRIIAYIIDSLFIGLFVSMVLEIRGINPYYDEYVDANDKFNEVIEEFTFNSAFDSTKSEELIDVFCTLQKYSIYNNGITLACYLLYFVGFQKWNRCQSLGKKVMKIKVVDKDGENPSWLQMLFRNILIYNLISTMALLVTGVFGNNFYVLLGALFFNAVSVILTYAVAITLLVRKDGRGLHDIICGTNVVME